MLVALSVSLLSGCDDNRRAAGTDGLPAAGRGTALKDVVVNAESSHPASWRAVEHLSIGLVDGPDPYVFASIADVDVDKSGRIYILDGMNLYVRVFDSLGEFIFEMGGPGGGPGEFRAFWVWAMGLIGDSLVAVHNNWAGELVLFDLEGTYVSTIRLTPVGHSAATTDVADLGHGQILLHGKHGYGTRLFAESQGREILLRVDLNDGTIDTLVEYQPHDVIPHALSQGVMELFPRPFPSSEVWTVGPGGRIAFGNGEAYVITVYDPMWRAVARLTGPTVPRDVTKEDVAAFREQFPFGSGMDDMPPAMRRAAATVLSEMEYPTEWPAYDQLLYDSEGRLWVRNPVRPKESFATWDVYDTALQYVAVAEIPSDIKVLKIQNGMVYGKATDQLGVPSVKVYRLIK